MSDSEGDKMLKTKLYYSAIAALIFVAVSLPQVYSVTDMAIDTYNPSTNCPSPLGKFLHSGVFCIILFLIMKIMNGGMKGALSNGLMAKYSFYSTLVFFLLSSSDSYMLTNSVIGGLSNQLGCPTTSGIIVHALVYLVVLTLVMYFPKDE